MQFGQLYGILLSEMDVHECVVHPKQLQVWHYCSSMEVT